MTQTCFNIFSLASEWLHSLADDFQTIRSNFSVAEDKAQCGRECRQARFYVLLRSDWTSDVPLCQSIDQYSAA